MAHGKGSGKRAAVVLVLVLGSCAAACGSDRSEKAPVLLTSTPGQLAYYLQAIYYDPPGTASKQRYEIDPPPPARWQTLDDSGNTSSVEVSAVIHPVTSPITVTNYLNLTPGLDIPTGLADDFLVSLGIPGTLDVYAGTEPERLLLDYNSARSVLLPGDALLAIAESSANAQDVLYEDLTSGPGQPDVEAVNTFITPDIARNLLLMDPNFFAESDAGPLAVRTSDQVSGWVQSNPDRFQPLPILGNSPANTTPVPRGASPSGGDPIEFLTVPFAIPASAQTAAGALFQKPVNITAPGFGTQFVEEYRNIAAPTDPGAAPNEVTLLMGTPCLQGMVDLYYDGAFGTALYVSHDIELVPAANLGNPPWYSKCTGNLARLNGTVCDIDIDCDSLVCANGVCAPPACSPHCDVGAPCGAGGDLGDCTSLYCEIGVCTTN
jgi:hypothetical protein